MSFCDIRTFQHPLSPISVSFTHSRPECSGKYLSAEISDTLIFRVVKIIVEHLPSGNATIQNVASELFLSTRKLQRLLKEKETSFIALLNETRKDIAKQYVQDKDMDLTEISFFLGFSEQSTFSRSFKRWTGKSPSSYRKIV